MDSAVCESRHIVDDTVAKSVNLPTFLRRLITNLALSPFFIARTSSMMFCIASSIALLALKAGMLAHLLSSVARSQWFWAMRANSGSGSTYGAG